MPSQPTTKVGGTRWDVFPTNPNLHVYTTLPNSPTPLYYTPWQVKMLEALQDIEIASKLVGFDADNDDSLDDKYKKLRCDIAPLSHDSEDYKLIEKYLLTTHAPTHTVG